jgi:UDP-4-amino-4-deoxy-L-arabinose-oxoglutarate aminotransferase
LEEYGVYLAKENSNNEAPRADPSILLRTRARGASLRKLSLHGITKRAADRYVDKYRHWEVKMLGWKCNMSNIQASLLLNQLANIEKYLARREKIARKYEEAFSDLRGIRFPKVPKNSKSGRHLFTIWVDPKKRDKALHYLHTKGIGAAVNYRAIHTLDYF